MTSAEPSASPVLRPQIPRKSPFFFNVSNTSASYATTFDQINEIYRTACDQGISDECDPWDSPQWNDPEENPDEFTSLQEAAQEVLSENQFNRFRDTGEDWGVDH